MNFLLSALVLSLLNGKGLCCVIERWDPPANQSWDWTTHQCENPAHISTFYAQDGMECCPMPGSLRDSPVIVTYAFNDCPEGYFVQGLMDMKNEFGYLDFYRCVKPAGLTTEYKSCYREEDVKRKCKPGYFYAGDENGSTMKCCKPFHKAVIDSHDKMKVRIMEETLYDMANLADMLGYKYTKGCRASAPGENFNRVGDTWIPSEGEECVGEAPRPEGFKIEFKNWKFLFNSITLGKQSEENLTPEVLRTGTFTNNHSTETTKTLEETVHVEKVVTHTETNTWSQKHEASFSVEIGYGLLLKVVSGKFTAGYKFNHEKAGKTEDSNQTKDSRSFTVSSSKSLAPFSAAKWKILVTKAKVTIPYTANYIMPFSTAFHGFLREDNHYEFGKDFVGEVFGNEQKPFYKYLRGAPRDPNSPWMWSDLYSNKSQHLMDKLCNETRYEVQLSGIITAIEGLRVDVVWEDL